MSEDTESNRSSSVDQSDGSSRKEDELNDGPPPAPVPRGPAQQFKNPVTFRECFRAFSKFGDTKSDGKFITLSQSDKWMKQAKVIDGKKITTTDTGIFFKKFKQQKLTVIDYEKFLADLTKNKNLNVEEVKRQMGACGQPGLSTTTTPNKVPTAVERLTDTSKYTGSHKQRFDETGKGKGLEGRKDLPDKSGFLCPRICPYTLSCPAGSPFLIVEQPELTDGPGSNDIEISVEIAIEAVEDYEAVVDSDKRNIVQEIVEESKKVLENNNNIIKTRKTGKVPKGRPKGKKGKGVKFLKEEVEKDKPRRPILNNNRFICSVVEKDDNCSEEEDEEENTDEAKEYDNVEEDDDWSLDSEDYDST